MSLSYGGALDACVSLISHTLLLHSDTATSSLPATPITAAAAIPNPFKKLPWNAKREREREARRLKQESAMLHRQLGITEDASYEEITAACDRLIAQVWR